MRPPRGQRGGGLMSSPSSVKREKPLDFKDVKANPNYGNKPGDVDYNYKGDPSELVGQPFQDTRGFWGKLFRPNTASELNQQFLVGNIFDRANLDNQLNTELKLAREKANLEKEAATHESTLAAEKQRTEDAAYADAVDALLSGEKGGNYYAPFKSTDFPQGPVSMRGAAYRAALGNAPLLSSIPTLGAAALESSKKASLIGTPEYDENLRQSTFGKMQKEGAIGVGPNEAMFLPSGDKYMGARPTQTVEQTRTEVAPGVYMPGQPKVTTSYSDPTALPKQTPEMIDRFKGSSLLSQTLRSPGGYLGENFKPQLKSSVQQPQQQQQQQQGLIGQPQQNIQQTGLGLFLLRKLLGL